MNAESVRELITHDCKSESELKIIKNLKSIEFSELDKLETDIKSL